MDFDFQVSVQTDGKTGDILAVYFQIRRGKASVTKEFANGIVFADYNRNGKLLGIEMLAPCTIRVFDDILKKDPTLAPRKGREQAPAKRFLYRAVPRKMILNR